MKHKRIDAIFKRITTYGNENTDSTSSPLQRHDSNDPIVQLEEFVTGQEFVERNMQFVRNLVILICWQKILYVDEKKKKS